MSRTLIKVLAIYPAFDIDVNEMAMVWALLCTEKPIHCSVITTLNDRLKGHATEKTFEQHSNLEIYRFLHPLEVNGEIMKIVRKMKPDVIFCAVRHNMKIALSIQKVANAPIVLHDEFFFDNPTLLRRRYFLGLPFLRPYVYDFYRLWLIRRTFKILCSNPLELPAFSMGKYPSVRYLPWPHPDQKGTLPSFSERGKNFSIFIGSIFQAKGANTLLQYYSRLMQEKPETRLSIVGPALDRAGRKVLDAIKDIGGANVKIRNHCSRSEIAPLLQKSLFVLSPGSRLGWGLIGDAWANGTPILAFKEHYSLKGGYNCLIVPNASEFCETVAVLQNDGELWNQISRGGLRTVKACHSIELSMRTLWEEIMEIIRN